jgi:peptidyl-prolyl cis-trans isomerase C
MSRQAFRHPQRPPSAVAARIAAVMILAVLGPAALAAAGSAVIAESPRAKVTRADYDAELAKLPPADRAIFASSRPRLVQMLNNLYLNRAVASDAHASGLDRDPVLAAQIQIQVEKILTQAMLSKLDLATAAAFDADPEKYAGRAREIYVTQSDRYRISQRVRVAHLLIKIGPDGDEAAQARAEALRARAVAGTPFKDLVREASDDNATSGKGGDLGFIDPKKYDPDFVAAALALQAPGDLSPVVKSKGGYHLIVLKERTTAGMKPFDEVKPEIMAEIRKKLQEDARQAYIEKMFVDPPPKVDEALIDQINADARAGKAPVIEAPSTGKR